MVCDRAANVGQIEHAVGVLLTNLNLNKARMCCTTAVAVGSKPHLEIRIPSESAHTRRIRGRCKENSRSSHQRGKTVVTKIMVYEICITEKTPCLLEPRKLQITA